MPRTTHRFLSRYCATLLFAILALAHPAAGQQTAVQRPVEGKADANRGPSHRECPRTTRSRQVG